MLCTAMYPIQKNPILAVFTGAGLSAESGIPTFRVGVDALWEGHSIEEVCDFRTWRNNRHAVHNFYNARRLAAARAQPNAAHIALSAWQARWGGERVVLMTQNVDDLLERAGATDVCHLHGRLDWMRCTACDHRWHVGAASWNPDTDRCPHCSSPDDVKPDVVFFHEMAPEYDRLISLVERLRMVDSAVVMGTSCQVVPFDFYLSSSPCWTAINSLDPVGEMGDRVLRFDKVLAGTATDAVVRLEGVLSERMQSGVDPDKDGWS